MADSWSLLCLESDIAKHKVLPVVFLGRWVKNVTIFSINLMNQKDVYTNFYNHAMDQLSKSAGKLNFSLLTNQYDRIYAFFSCTSNDARKKCNTITTVNHLLYTVSFKECTVRLCWKFLQLTSDKQGKTFWIRGATGPPLKGLRFFVSKNYMHPHLFTHVLNCCLVLMQGFAF